MAFAVRETQIANPASRGSGKKRVKKMAAKRRLSAKQIKAGFGGKRRKAAAKQTRRHAARTRPVKRRNAAPKVRRAAPRRQPARKRNLGEIVSILLPGVAGNPARRKGQKTMAARKRKTKRASAQRNAGSRRMKTMHVTRRHSRRGNPGQVTGYLKAGAAVIGGAVGSKILTQVVLGTKNTSWMGYIGNAVATAVLGAVSHAVLKDKAVSQMVIAGGVAQIFVRVIGDQTPYGSYLTGAGVGDYQASAFLTPQRMIDARRNAALEIPGWGAPATTPIVTHAASGAGVGAYNAMSEWN